jgi:decaprenylphospho-beta-D-erythro-pentofuranosid-2-ulose 2-reductase
MTRILIISATSMIAEYTARLWGNKDVEFVLIAKDAKKLAGVAADLTNRTGAKCEQIIMDFTSPKEVKATMARVFKTPVHTALIAQGVLTRQKDAKETSVIFDSVAINAASPAMFAEAIATGFEAQGFGRCGIIGSVAGERGREDLYVYGASKAFLEKFVEGLNNRFNSKAIRFTIIKPGPIATPMVSPGRQMAAVTAKPETAARIIVKAMARGKRKVFAPKFWALVSFIMRSLPAAIFDRIKL